MQPFTIGNIVAMPGSIGKGKLGSIYLSDGTQVDIPVMVMNGKSAGPVLWLGAAMHGQELSGIAVLWEIFRQIAPNNLKGTIVAAPLLNPLSFNGGTYFTPQDGYNINRVFPGDAKGLTTSRMANLIVEEGIKKVDYIIDFHANPDPAMCFAIIKESSDQALFARCREMAAAFGITTVEMLLAFEAHRTGHPDRHGQQAGQAGPGARARALAHDQPTRRQGRRARRAQRHEAAGHDRR